MSVDANWLVRTMYVYHCQATCANTVETDYPVGDGNKQSEIYPCHEVALVIMPHMHISVKYHNP